MKNFLLRASILFFVLLSQIKAASTTDDDYVQNITTIKMEGYNNWHLGFAKTLQISGEGDFEVFPDNYYTTILDPCAYFSVIFVSSALTTTLTRSTIAYNYYGEYGIPMSGYWMNVTVTMRDQRDWTNEDYEEFTWLQYVFVADKQGPINGGEGVLGLALVPSALWVTSAMRSWRDVYDIPYQYANFVSNQTDEYSHKKTYLRFSKYDDIFDELGGRDAFYRIAYNNFTNEQLDSLEELVESTNTTPFLDVEFALIQVSMFTVENFATFWESDYQDNMFLATYNPQVVIPLTTYDYLEEQFYQFLCELYSSEEETAYTDPMYQCACSGDEFFGIPSLQLITKYRYVESDPFESSGYMYDITPNDQELFPSIDQESRSTVCSLAIGNLKALDKNNEEDYRMENSFGLGQIFFRKYQLVWTNERYPGTGVIETKFYTLMGDPVQTILEKISGFLIFFTFVLAGFVGLTFLKLNRVRLQRKTYLRLKELSKEYDIKVSKDFQKQILGDQAGIEYLKGNVDMPVQPGFLMNGQLDMLVDEKPKVVELNQINLPNTERRRSTMPKASELAEMVKPQQ